MGDSNPFTDIPHLAANWGSDRWRMLFKKNSVSAELAQKMDGAPILAIEIAQNKAYTALFGFPTQDFFNFIQGDPSLLAGIPQAARVAAWGGGFPINVGGEIVGAIGVSGAPTVQNDVDCARAALALVSDALPTK